VSKPSYGSLVLAACLALPAVAFADAPSSAPEAVPATAAAPVLLPANSVIELEMADAVSSETSKPGDFFRMRVAVAISDGTRIVVPAGTVAVGQVVHAARAHGGGKGGELILAARYLELPQGQVRLRSTFGAAGASRVKTSLALAVAVGPFAMMVKGHRMELPAGAALSARIAADTTILGATPVPASP
jgi:hypothetical protein